MLHIDSIYEWGTTNRYTAEDCCWWVVWLEVGWLVRVETINKTHLSLVDTRGRPSWFFLSFAGGESVCKRPLPAACLWEQQQTQPVYAKWVEIVICRMFYSCNEICVPPTIGQRRGGHTTQGSFILPENNL